MEYKFVPLVYFISLSTFYLLSFPMRLVVHIRLIQVIQRQLQIELFSIFLAMCFCHLPKGYRIINTPEPLIKISVLFSHGAAEVRSFFHVLGISSVHVPQRP